MFHHNYSKKVIEKRSECRILVLLKAYIYDRSKLEPISAYSKAKEMSILR